MIRLYGHPFSSNSRKVRWALEELGLTYEYVTVVGDAFSIADIALAESFALCESARIDIAPYPELRAWLGLLRERPAFVKTRPSSPSDR